MKRNFTFMQILGLLICAVGAALILICSPSWLWLIILGGLMLWIGYRLYKLY
ncbi:MAG: hypothetical protein PHP06_09990 [Clostridia bacterium]|nr:hypothetical protein [Clostridia bacterium]